MNSEEVLKELVCAQCVRYPHSDKNKVEWTMESHFHGVAQEMPYQISEA